jgi:hypothetical protein
MSQHVKKKKKFTKWIQLEHPITVKIDGQTGNGIILKPAPQEKEIMDEQESSGI